MTEPCEEYDFKVIQRLDDAWVVVDPEGNEVAGPFDDPVEAGKWCRDMLIKRRAEDARN